MNKTAQAISTILTFGAVIIGLFVLIAGYPMWQDTIQDYANNHPDEPFNNFLIQIIPPFAVIMLLLLLFIPGEVNPFSS